MKQTALTQRSKGLTLAQLSLLMRCANVIPSLTWKTVIIAVATVLLSPVASLGQGYDPTHIYGGSEFDSPDYTTGNLYAHVPVISYPQRGSLAPLALFARYNAPGWIQVKDGCATCWVWQFNGGPGVQIVRDNTLMMYNVPYQPFNPGPIYSYAHVKDASGADHSMGAISDSIQESIDATGIQIRSGVIKDRHGISHTGSGYNIVYGNMIFPPDGFDDTVTDPDGNSITPQFQTVSGSIEVTGWTDSIGRHVPAPLYTDRASSTCSPYSFPSVGGASNEIIKFCYEQYTITSDFGVSGVKEGTAVQDFLTAIVYPNGTSWSFQYNSWGDLESITTPLGAIVTYGWASNVTAQVATRYVNSRSVNAGDGTGTHTWSYQIPLADATAPTVITDPDLNDVVYRSASPLNGTIEQDYTGSHTSGTVYRTYERDFTNPVNTGMNGASSYASVVPLDEITTWPNGEASKLVFTYDQGTAAYDPNFPSTTFTILYGSLIQKTTYSYGSGSPGPILAQEINTYEWQNNTDYLGANLLDRVCLTTIYGPGSVTAQPSCTAPAVTNNQASQTAYGYDENNGSPQGVYGHLTSTTKWLNTGKNVRTQTVFNAHGMPSKALDGRTNPTVFTYDTTGLFLSGIQYPNTGAVTHIENYSFDSNTGLILSHTDQNKQVSSYSYVDPATGGVDPMNRLHSVTLPATIDGNTGIQGKGVTVYSYVDTVGSVSLTTSTLITGSQKSTTEVFYDGLGRVIKSQSSSLSGPPNTILTVYDDLGRVHSVTSPYQNTSDPTYNIISFGYDVLGRVTSRSTSPTLSNQKWSFDGSSTTYIDASGNSWMRTTDSLGRLVKVLEPNGASQGASLETDYSYDTLGNLLSATQIGSQGNVTRVRTFAYDSLSRLVKSNNPETGTICYGTLSGSNCINGYDANGNLLIKIDARTRSISYNYDALNRLISKSYSDSTPSACYQYDVAARSGTTANLVGHLAAEWTQTGACPTSTVSSFPASIGSGEAMMQYDSMGRLVQEFYCTPQICDFNSSSFAQYDLAGNRVNLDYPDGRHLLNSFDAVGRWAGVKYNAWNSTPESANYLTVNSFDPAGHFTQVTLGTTAMEATAGYDGLGRISSLVYASGAGSTTLWSRTYAWTPNSNLQSYTDPVAKVTRQFGYDTLNRLVSAQDIVGSGGSGSGQNDNSSDQSENNVLEDSQFVGSAGWSAASANITPNSIAAPDGSMTATSVVSASGSQDTYIADAASNPNLYSSAPFQGSVWLRVPSGTLTTKLYIINVGNQGWSSPGVTSVNLTTAWQKFTVSGTNQNGLTSLIFQIGGASTISAGQEIDVWGAELQPASNGVNVTNFLPYSQNMQGSTWADNIGVTVNAAIAPDGTQTANKLTGPSGSTDSYANDWVTSPAEYSGQTVTASAYLQGSTSVNVYLVYKVGSTQYSYPTSVTLNNQWQRVAITRTLPAGVTSLGVQIGGGLSITAGQNVYVWGSQMEVGSAAHQYVATQDVPVTTISDTTNILPSSGQIAGPSWGVAQASYTTNTATAPDGTQTADTVTASTGSTDSWIEDYAADPSLYDNATVTTSIYARVASGTLPVNFYLIAGGNSGWSAPASSQITLSTNWQRFELTGTVQNGLTSLAMQLGGSGSFKAGQSIQLWGAQMVLGTSEGTYTGTTSTSPSGSTLASNGLNQSYAYDAFGNMNSSGNFNFMQAYTSSNQLSGWQYDQSGNLQVDGFNNVFTYDAESRISSVTGGSSYVYDANGDRVGKTGGVATDYIYFDGKQIARYSGGQWTDLIYGPTGLIAEVAGTPTALPTYRILDHLGTQVGTVDSNGQLLSLTDYAPFGQVFTGGTSDPYMFTGKERDTESGNDYFGARYYGSSMGRFMSPDWSSAPDPIPSADLEDPQSLNLYSYGGNNPIINVDADGHDCVNASNAANGTVSYISTSNPADCGKGYTYVDGTVDPNSFSYNSKTGDLSFNISNYSDGSGTAGTVDMNSPAPYDHPGIDGPQNAAIFGQIGNQGMGAINLFMTNMALSAGGDLLAGGAEALLAARAARAAEAADAAARAASKSWKFGKFKSATKWANQLLKRGWTEKEISETIANGERFPAVNNINPANGATRYVSPSTGKSVVVDNVTNEVLHVGGSGFQY